LSSGPPQNNNVISVETKNIAIVKSTSPSTSNTSSEKSNISNDSPTKQFTTENKKEEVVLKNNNDVKVNDPSPIITKPGLSADIKSIAQKNTTANSDNNNVKKQDVPAQIIPQKQAVQQPVAVKTETPKNAVVQNIPVTQKNTISNSDNAVLKKQDAPAQIIAQKQTAQPGVVKTETPKNAVVQNIPATQQKQPYEAVKELPASVATRKNETTQDIYFKGDSLVLSLYDNGIVDGDTVSVFLNGENIISKQKLKEAAVKKTIYITPGSPDSLQLVLFAENLGTIPPNTGLLTIRDGDNIYQVRFSADLSKNASILLRRKKE
jgi:hypothetical protein